VEISPFLVPIVFFLSVPITIVGVMFARGYQKRAEQASRRTELSPALEARLDRMEQAMDAIAVEVERISEAQRFTTKLLSDRPRSAAGLIEGDPERR
jgi:hypothetical protein